MIQSHLVYNKAFSAVQVYAISVYLILEFCFEFFSLCTLIKTLLLKFNPDLRPLDVILSRLKNSHSSAIATGF